MSLYKRKDSSVYWLKVSVGGRTIQRSTGTSDKIKAQEYHDTLKAQLWLQQRLGVKPVRSWKEAVVRWLNETSDKVTHLEDKRKLAWMHQYLGDLNLDEINQDAIDQIRSVKL